jgi:paraquat-inducible protein A
MSVRTPNPSLNGPPDRVWACRLCGYAHRTVALHPGERAVCVRCGTMLAKRGRLGPDAPLAFTLTGMFLAIPAAMLPIVSVAKLHVEHHAVLMTGIRALWDDGMRLLAIWVFLCGTLAPALLLAILLGLLLPASWRRRAGAEQMLCRGADALEHWAMPEVHVLAVLVAFTKLGSLVSVSIGPGFWCYAIMSIMLLLAWRSFDCEVSAPTEGAARRATPAFGSG